VEKDDRSDQSRRSTSLLGWLVLALAALTGYVIWQIAPLTARMDALERDRLAIRDEMLAQLDHMATQMTASEQPAEPTPAAQAAVAPDTPPAAPTPGPRPPVEPSGEALEFLDRHLFPADAVIARLMVGNAPPENIARLTNHSRAYVVARGMQIDKLISSAAGAPPEIARALRAYVRQHGAAR
jgi:hypothetical protein